MLWLVYVLVFRNVVSEDCINVILLVQIYLSQVKGHRTYGRHAAKLVHTICPITASLKTMWKIIFESSRARYNESQYNINCSRSISTS
jgi:hypothetical protein